MAAAFLDMRRVDFITIETEGPPGQRIFYLQAAQDDMLITLIIEKEHAAALAMGIQQMLQQLGGVPADDWIPTDLLLRQPVQPLFRVGGLGLGYDHDSDSLIVVARAPGAEEEEAPEVHLWITRAQSYALARHAAEVVAAGRPRCPLCNEPLDPERPHACVRGNGRKQLFHTDS